MHDAMREQTLVVIKPDGVQRSLIGDIIHRIERTGLKLTALSMRVPDAAFVRVHYTLDVAWLTNVGNKAIKGMQDAGETPESIDPIVMGNKVLDTLSRYMTSGPVVAMVWEGPHAAAVVRKVVGGTEPLSSDVGTIRGDFVIDSYPLANGAGRAVRNLVHASGNAAEAVAEIKHWFPDAASVLDYRLVSEQILHDVNLDGRAE